MIVSADESTLPGLASCMLSPRSQAPRHFDCLANQKLHTRTLCSLIMSASDFAGTGYGWNELLRDRSEQPGEAELALAEEAENAEHASLTSFYVTMADDKNAY